MKDSDVDSLEQASNAWFRQHSYRKAFGVGGTWCVPQGPRASDRLAQLSGRFMANAAFKVRRSFLI